MEASTGTKTVFALAHVTVAAILIPAAWYGTSRGQEAEGTIEDEQMVSGR
ncbi:hypothetical protein ACN3XK_10175 [Actinomadura welshii]